VVEEMVGEMDPRRRPGAVAALGKDKRNLCLGQELFINPPYCRSYDRAKESQCVECASETNCLREEDSRQMERHLSVPTMILAHVERQDTECISRWDAESPRAAKGNVIR